MKRQGAWRSSPARATGLLLLEAGLTVAVVGVSLVFLTRSFGAGLRAMAQARRYEAALAYGERTLQELEAAAEHGEPLRSGETVDGIITWKLALAPFTDPNELVKNAQLCEATVTVTERSGASAQVSLTTLIVQPTGGTCT